MFSYIAMTAMGRWFEARRGQAVSLTNLGHPAGEVVVPILAVVFIASIGWRSTWVVVAAILCLVIAPTLWLLLKGDRSPQGHTSGTTISGLAGRHWRRRDAARHWLLSALLPVLLTQGSSARWCSSSRFISQM